MATLTVLKKLSAGGQADPRQALVYQNNPGNRERVRDTVAAAQSKAILSVQSGYRDRPKREEIDALRREAWYQLGRSRRDHCWKA